MCVKNLMAGKVRPVKSLVIPLLAAAFALNLQNCLAGTLGLEEAERLALQNDPGIEAVNFRSEALRELSVAARQLPDPMLKLGVMSLPVDSFELGQEPMTQLALGLTQKFPRGNSRELRSQQYTHQSEMLQESIQDQRLRTELAVRELYLEIVQQQQRALVNDKAIQVFTDLSGITRDYLAAGRVPQQDVLQAAVEVARAKERASQISEAEARARAELSVWLGSLDESRIAADWPSLAQPLSLGEIEARLKNHPRILALQKQVQAAETRVELSRQEYKPEFSVDLSYGARAGTDLDGSSRPDLFSVMLVMDLPLFHEQRQDRVQASRIAESSAAMSDRDDVYRRMRSEAELNAVTWQQQQERLALFTSSILPQARFSSESSLEAYQSNTGDLTSLLRAQLTEIDLQLEYVRIQAEALKSQARLLYLQGESA